MVPTPGRPHNASHHSAHAEQGLEKVFPKTSGFLLPIFNVQTRRVPGAVLKPWWHGS